MLRTRDGKIEGGEVELEGKKEMEKKNMGTKGFFWVCEWVRRLHLCDFLSLSYPALFFPRCAREFWGRNEQEIEREETRGQEMRKTQESKDFIAM